MAQADQDVVMEESGTASLETRDWRRDVKAVVLEVLAPATLSWMDEDNALRDSRFLSRAMCEVKTRLERLAQITCCGTQVADINVEYQAMQRLLRVSRSGSSWHASLAPSRDTSMRHAQQPRAVFRFRCCRLACWG